MRAFLAAAVLSTSVTFIAPAAAQHAFAAPAGITATATGEQWGTGSDIVVTTWAADFHFFGFPGTEGPLNLTTGARACATGDCGWAAGLNVPSGAQLLGVELSACDGDPAQELTFWLLQAPKVPGAATVLGSITGTGATPGCATFSTTLPSPHTVQNDVEGYALVVNTNPGTNLDWNQFRVRYRLQVSPAPAAATFPNDVPTTHPFFRFIEALAAAGITGGCGAGSFCPDTPVTRGEVAVFLASALGLHFPD